MDPKGCVTYWLFRDATKYVNGAHVKVGCKELQLILKFLLEIRSLGQKRMFGIINF